MSKAIIEFDLNDPDDRTEHERCVKATDMAIVLWEFYSNSKKTLESKIGECIKIDKEFSHYDVLDMIFDHFRELLDEQSLNIDKLLR